MDNNNNKVIVFFVFRFIIEYYKSENSSGIHKTQLGLGSGSREGIWKKMYCTSEESVATRD